MISRSASPSPSPTPSPTLSGLPVAVQPAQPSGIPVSLHPRLAVIQAQARILRSGTVQAELRQAQSSDLQINDAIEITKLAGQSQQGFGIFHLPDLANVELFDGTKLVLAGMQQDSEGAIDLILDLDDGQMFVHLNEEKTIRVTVQTPHAVIKSLTSGAEFDVCHDAERTCIVVKRGAVEVVAKSRQEIVRAGSAGVILEDEPLSELVCAPVAKFIAWEEQYRSFDDAPALQQEIAELPQAPCPKRANGFPWQARILYRDEFRSPSRGWDQGTSDIFTARYVRDSGASYYQVQAEGPGARHLTFVPNERVYEDANIDVKTRTKTASIGDFHYGVVFRRSGEQYYAFTVSPSSKSWYFVKHSSNGLRFLKYGPAERMRGLEGQDTLSVETYGSIFLLFINGRFIDWVRDSEYARGEVGFFVETIDNPDVLINFNSIVIWDIPAAVFVPQQGENCFNAGDDDGDGSIDQADADCQRQELIVTSSPTSPARPTATPRTAATPTAPPAATNPPAATATNRPPPTTQPPLPTLSLPTLIPPLPTISLPTLIPPLPTISLPTISLPLPTIQLPLPIVPPKETPTPQVTRRSLSR